MNKTFLCLAACVLSVSCPAIAQERQPQRPSNQTAEPGWALAVGGGTVLAPKYLGADEYELSLLPYVRVTHGGRFFASVQEGVGYAAINSENFRLGPLAKFEFGRDEDGSSPFRVAGGGTDDLLGLGDIDSTVSLGGFADLDLGSLTASLKVGKALGGHAGITGQLGVNYKGVLRFNGPPLIYSFGPNLKFGDSDYTNSFFGVDAVQSQASGLSIYQADGGLVSYGVSATAILPITDNTSATFIASFDRLSGNITDAPLVRTRGSRDQGFVGAFVAYRFD